MAEVTPPPMSSRAVTAVTDLLGRETLMTLACIRPDGWPQATTVGHTHEGLNLYFVIARKSQKFANLQANPRASVAIRLKGGGQGDGVGLSMGGHVSEVTDPAEIERINRAVIARHPEVHVYCPSGDAVAVMRFQPVIISAVGVAGGRSDAEVFSIGQAGQGSVSHLF